jgi:hypothetical protein
VSCGLGRREWRCRVLGELGASVEVRGTKEQGQLGFYLHFGPFRPMIFLFVTSTTQYMYIFDILNIIQDTEDIIHTRHGS